MQRTLVVMVKVPRPGQVKTRLGREIGMVPAAWWFRHQMKRLIVRLRDPRWHLALAVDPLALGMRTRVWPHDLERLPQGRGDLGHRMKRQFRLPAKGPVCVIGADIPGVSKAHISRAFEILGNHEAVVGPATDGGYWLVGLKRVAAVPNFIFENVRWSGPNALSDTIATLACRRFGYADTLQDVDSAHDLAIVRKAAKTERRFCP